MHFILESGKETEWERPREERPEARIQGSWIIIELVPSTILTSATELPLICKLRGHQTKLI